MSTEIRHCELCECECDEVNGDPLALPETDSGYKDTLPIREHTTHKALCWMCLESILKRDWSLCLECDRLTRNDHFWNVDDGICRECGEARKNSMFKHFEEWIYRS